MREERKFTWKVADLGGFVKNFASAILKGQLLVRLNAGKYLIHIAYLFLLFGLAIYFGLRIETAMATVERNKAEIKELEIIHDQKVLDMVRLSRRSVMEDELKDLGSEVREAEKPAFIVKK